MTGVPGESCFPCWILPEQSPPPAEGEFHTAALERRIGHQRKEYTGKTKVKDEHCTQDKNGSESRLED